MGKKGRRIKRIPAISKNTTVLIGTSKGLRRCSKYLMTAVKRKAPPIAKHAVLTNCDRTLTGSIRFCATFPRPTELSAIAVFATIKVARIKSTVFIRKHMIFIVFAFKKWNFLSVYYKLDIMISNFSSLNNV